MFVVTKPGVFDGTSGNFDRNHIFFTGTWYIQPCLWQQNQVFFKETSGHFQPCFWRPKLDILKVTWGHPKLYLWWQNWVFSRRPWDISSHVCCDQPRKFLKEALRHFLPYLCQQKTGPRSICGLFVVIESVVFHGKSGHLLSCCGSL